MVNLAWADAYSIAGYVRSGEIEPEEVVEFFLERIRRYDQEIRAFITINQRALEEARSTDRKGPLAGVPVAVKDNILTRGLRTTFGSKLFEDYIPTDDSVVIERLRRAGAVVLGKTNMPEFGLIAHTDNLIVGPTRNPWDPDKSVGGSSGGSAAAVAAGLAPVALGNDGGGSIRIPAAFCGVYGFKPSYGRIPVYPRILKLFLGLHVEGFITRTVRDAALLMNIVSGHDLRDPESIPDNTDYLASLDSGIEGRRVAYSLDLGYAVIDEEVERVFMNSLKYLERAGAIVEEAKIKLLDVSHYLRVKVTYEVMSTLKDRLDEWLSKMYPLYRGFIKLAGDLNFDDYIKAQGIINELWDTLWRIFRDYHYLVTPTTAIPPFSLNESPGPRVIRGRDVGVLGWMPFTYPFNFTKQPAASIPMGHTSNGLPVGLQIIGRPYDDLGVLQASRALEEELRWDLRHPRVGT